MHICDYCGDEFDEWAELLAHLELEHWTGDEDDDD